MAQVITGKVWKYGDNINTDIISPPQYMELQVKDAAKYTMSAIDPDFSKKFRPGDILVAGDNLGSGSSRETAPLTLKFLGVNTIVASSFARIFYRNAINLGIMVLECPDTDRIATGDVIEIDYSAGSITNTTREETYTCTKMPEHITKIIDKGGLVPYLKEYVEKKKAGETA